MLLLTLLDHDINLWRAGMLFIGGMLMGFAATIAYYSRHWLLLSLVGGTGFVLSLIIIQQLLISWLALSQWHSYVAALGISWLPFGGWVLYRALRYEDLSQTVAQQRAAANTHLIEHTPIYDDFEPRFE